MLEPGTKAPDFDLTDGTGRRVRLADFAGKGLILFFYPSDFTPT
jgi:peroxiredoxin Q/BCP